MPLIFEKPLTMKVFTVATIASGGLALASPKVFTHTFYVISTFYAFIFASR